MEVTEITYNKDVDKTEQLLNSSKNNIDFFEIVGNY